MKNVIWIFFFQFVLKFKVQYIPTPTIIDLDIDIPPIGVDMVMIKIKNEELNLEETLETKNGGVVATKEKYAFGTKFTVEVTKVGWENLPNQVDTITVDADEKKNDIVFSVKPKEFKLSFNVVGKADGVIPGAPIPGVKIQMRISDGAPAIETLETDASGKAETKKSYRFDWDKFEKVEVSKDGYILVESTPDLSKGITVGAEQKDNVISIVMSKPLVSINTKSVLIKLLSFS